MDSHGVQFFHVAPLLSEMFHLQLQIYRHDIGECDKEKSFYNNLYYKLKLPIFGQTWLREKFDDLQDNSVDYSLGEFNENGKFQSKINGEGDPMDDFQGNTLNIDISRPDLTFSLHKPIY